MQHGASDFPEGIEIPEVHKKWYAKVEKICKQVPFIADWVAYKGEIVFAELDLEKSLACGRPIIGIGYCATAVIVNQRIDSYHNFSPHFQPCKLSDEWKTT